MTLTVFFFSFFSCLWWCGGEGPGELFPVNIQVNEITHVVGIGLFSMTELEARDVM